MQIINIFIYTYIWTQALSRRRWWNYFWKPS